MKKLISIVTVLMMIVSAFPAAASPPSYTPPEVLSVSVTPRKIGEGMQKEVEHYDEELGDWVSDGWYKYDAYPYGVTVTTAEGTVYYEHPDMLRHTFGTCGYVTDDQSPDNAWEPGVHTATFTLLGASCDFEVEVVPYPVVSVTADPVVLNEGLDGFRTTDRYGEDEYFFSTFSPVIHVTMDDGTVIDTDRSVYDYGYSTLKYGVQTDQSAAAPWGIGEHTATVTFANKSCEVKVTVIESPVDRIEFHDVELYENVAGEELRDGYDLWFRYEYTVPFTVYMKDGSSVEVTDGAFTVNGKEYLLETGDDDQWRHHWEAGDHFISVNWASFHGYVNIEVVPSAVGVESVTISGYETLDVEVRYKDGRVVSGRVESIDWQHEAVNPPYPATLTLEDGTELGVWLYFFDLDHFYSNVEEPARRMSIAVERVRSNVLEENAWMKANFLGYNVLNAAFLINHDAQQWTEIDPANAGIEDLVMLAVYSSTHMEREYSEGGDGQAWIVREGASIALERVFGIENDLADLPAPVGYDGNNYIFVPVLPCMKDPWSLERGPVDIAYDEERGVWEGAMIFENDYEIHFEADSDAVITRVWLEDLVLRGDANGDGVVNMKDVAYLKNIIAAAVESAPGADADRNGAVNVMDLTAIKKIVAGN